MHTFDSQSPHRYSCCAHGRKMALLFSLAAVMCELLPLFETTRVKRGIAPEVRSSGHSGYADMTAVAYDEKLLACERVEAKQRWIIQGKDKPFLEYYEDFKLWYAERKQGGATINCKTFTSPPKPSSILKNLTTHTLPEDVIGLIGSFNSDVHCRYCWLFDFNMTFFEKCRTALTRNPVSEWLRVRSEVQEEGGSCEPNITLTRKKTLQNCMAAPEANQVAFCTSFYTEKFIDKTERKIKAHQDTLQARQELIQQKVQEHQKFMKESQDVINKEQETIKDLQDDLDIAKQNIVYLEQIFQNP